MLDLSETFQIWPVPARFRNLLPRDWAKRGAVTYPDGWGEVRTWLSRFPRYLTTSPVPSLIGHSLVLSGPAGTGKTMLGSSLLNYLDSKAFTVAFARDRDLHMLLDTRYPSQEQEDLLFMLQRCACLVIDDVLRMGGRPETLEPFLRYRMDEGKPTIVTMNNEISMSAVLTSLLHEFTNVELAGEDVRILESRGAW